MADPYLVSFLMSDELCAFLSTKLAVVMVLHFWWFWYTALVSMRGGPGRLFDFISMSQNGKETMTHLRVKEDDTLLSQLTKFN